MPDETIRWMLSKEEGRVTCSQRPSADGIAVHVRYGTLPVASRQCVAEEEASRWADQIRHAWKASGWNEAVAVPG